MSLAVSTSSLRQRRTRLYSADVFSFLIQQSAASCRMPIYLQDLLEVIDVRAMHGSPATEIRGLCLDSRRVSPGDLFIAVPGARHDGHTFAGEAMDRGAAAVLATREIKSLRGAATLLVDDLPSAMAACAQRFYRYPQRDLDLVGVTGTNGKTTVAWLTRHLLSAQKDDVGLIGTVMYHLGRRSLPAHRTTPNVIDLYALLGQIRDHGLNRAVLEVSSHGLVQKRVAGLGFKVAAFLNLTPDHLDYHRTMEDYYAAKAQLFLGGADTTLEQAVVNADDPWGQRLLRQLPKDLPRLSFGTAPQADLRATAVRMDAAGSCFTLITAEASYPVQTSLPGHYNVSNVLAALAIAHSLGVPLPLALKRLANFEGVPGRMEQVAEGRPFSVLVDYAHTPDALANALAMLKPLTVGKLRVVFGCGGDRDRTKRAPMMEAARHWADDIIATADNPRREDMAQIFADMAVDLPAEAPVRWQEDRRRAIAQAIQECRPGDTLLIAGKGHEPYQEFADTIVPFDDRLVARELLATHAPSPTVHASTGSRHADF